MSEKDIEHGVCKYAESLGIVQFKFASPNSRGVPDRLYLYRGRVLFIEFKSEKATLQFSPLQQRQRDKIAGVSCPVFLVNDISKGKRIIDTFKDLVDTY